MMARILVALVWFWMAILVVGVGVTMVLGSLGVVCSDAPGYWVVGWMAVSASMGMTVMLTWVTIAMWRFVLTGEE